MQLCDYGCGQEAKFQFKNGKWCCSKSFNSCPSIQKKLSKLKKGKKLPPFSKEHKKNMSKSKIGRTRLPFSKDHKKNMSKSKMGKKRKPFTEDHKNKIRKSMKGKNIASLSEETKRKISKTIKDLWDDPNSVFYSEEFRINRSKSSKGKSNGMYGKYKENSSNWKGGTYEYWHKQAWELFGLDCCENCYITNEEHKVKWNRRLDMHNTLEPKDYKIMEPEAWMTLCRICHRGLEVALENERRWLKNYNKKLK